MEMMMINRINHRYLKGNQSSMLFLALLLGICLTAGFLCPSTADATTPIVSCGDCHGYWGTLGSSNRLVDNSTRDPNTGYFPGSHNTHTGPWYTTTDSRYNMRCETCHFSPNYSWYSHQRGSIQVNLRWLSLSAGGVIQDGSVSGWGSYSKWTSFPVSNTPTFGVCRNTYCHSNGVGGTLNTDDPRPIVPNISSLWGTNTPSFPVCTPCHGNETGNPQNGAPWYTSAYNTGSWVTTKANSHQLHAWQTTGSPVSGKPCYRCHYTTTKTGNTITSIAHHIKRNYTVAAGPYDQAGNRWLSYTYSYATNGGTCTAITCHSAGAGGAVTKRWGSNSTSATCVKCHGIITASWTSFNADMDLASPGYLTQGVSTWNTVGAITNNVSNATRVWAHDSHLRMIKGYSTISGVECSDCHDVTTIISNVWTTWHMNGTTNFAWSSMARNEGNNNPKWNTLVLSPWYSSGNQACGNIYCHGQSITVAGLWGSGWSSLRFNNNQWLTGSAAKSAGSCNKCHQAPPVTTRFYDHAGGGVTLPTNCTPCHGHEGAGKGHINGTLEASVQCGSCHAAAFPKALGGLGTIRNVSGAGGDFTMASRHLISTSTITKWDCVVCHMEGWATGAGKTAGDRDSAYHNEGSGSTGGQIDLRNVDTNALGWSIDNKVWTTNDYTDLDTFCLTCHDSNGAAGISVNSSNNGMDLGNGQGRALTPFNSTNYPGGVVGGSTWPTFTSRNAIIDIKSKFWSTGVGANYGGNPSQHAVLGRRYSTIWTSWSQSAWSSYTTKKTRTNINSSRETSLLSCADCHILDAGSGAHGGANLYNLTSSNPAAACNLCHAASVYTGVSSTASRFNHNAYTRTAGSYSAYGMTGLANCFLCHAGWDGTSTATKLASFGNIHGAWGTYPGGSGALTKYRFQPGTVRKNNYAADNQWGSLTAMSCYFVPTADQFANCNKHSAGPTGSYTPNYTRPVKY